MRSMFTKAGAGLAAFVLFAAVAAAAKPNFTGTWVLDPAKSEGLGGPQGGTPAPETMIVTQDGDKLAFERTFKSPQGDRVQKDTYTADGKEGEFTMPARGGGETKGKRTAKWSADGSVLEVNDKATFDTPNGAMSTEANSKWTLSADGKTLTVESTRTSQRGEQKSKRVYNKQ